MTDITTVIDNAACTASATSSQNDLMNFGSHDSRQLLTSDTDISYIDVSRKSDYSSFNDTMTNRLRRWSVTLAKGTNKGTKTIYQKTIERMPSRIQKALFPDSTFMIHDAEHLDQITQEIEQNETLMDPFAEQLRIETIKSMPQTLSVKRDIRAKITRSVYRRSSAKSMNLGTRCKYATKSYFTKSRYFVNAAIVNFEMWYNSMKEIEGHFGSAIGIYFKFLRSLLLMNMFVMAVVFGFVIFPQIIHDQTNGQPVLQATAGLALKIDDTVNENSTVFSAMDVLTSEGYIKTTLLFYGSYTNHTFSGIKGSKTTYSLPFAYFLTMICLYIMTFVLISCIMAQSYRKSFIQTSGNIEHLLSHKVFCFWDWGIANQKAANLKHNNIHSEFRELLEAITEKNTVKVQQTRLRWFWHVTSKATGHMLVLGLIFGIAYGMWTMLEWYNDKLDSNPELAAHSATPLILPLTVSVTMLTMQILFKCLSYAEDYNTLRVHLHINLLRNFFMEFVIVSVLVVYWISQGSGLECWETKIGQEIYRFVIVDFVVSTLGVSAVQMIRHFINKDITKKIDQSEFDISRSCLGLVFNQTLLWMGLLFSPPLAGIICLKMFLTFYIKKFCVINFCRAPSKLWRSHQTHTLFAILMFLSLLGVVVAHIYIITQVKSSNVCGPFRDHEYMYQVFMEGILKLKHDQLFFRILISVTKPAVVGGVILTLCVIVYYLRAKSRAQIAMVGLLKDMLFYEAKDKEFLLSNITKLTQGKEWLFGDDAASLLARNPPIQEVAVDEIEVAEPSNTWRYRSPKTVRQHLL